MTSGVGSRPRTTGVQHGVAGRQVADVFVVFGITGDLAKVMTFHSLYRLETRGLLDCPIVGVAVSDWSVEDLRDHARAAIEACGETIDEEVFDRFAGAAVVRERRLRRRRDVRARRRARSARRSSPVFYLEIPPFLFGTVIKGLSEAGLTKTARVVVEKPFGHDLASARDAGRRDPPVHRRVAALPDRPLPRQDGARARSSICGSRTRCSSRSGTATTSRASRSRWPRASGSRIAVTSTTRSARCGTWSSTT